MLAHLYRGEMYRSKVWRTRLDATTNWAVVTTGVAVSVAFSSPGSSPLPLVLVVLLDLVFLAMEARRYRYFDIWRTRVRMMEVSMYSPLLRLKGVRVDDGWNEALALDYEEPHFKHQHVGSIGTPLATQLLFSVFDSRGELRCQNMHSPNAGHGARATVGARCSWPGSWRNRLDHRLCFPRLLDLAGASHPRGQLAAGRVKERGARSRYCRPHQRADHSVPGSIT